MKLKKTKLYFIMIFLVVISFSYGEEEKNTKKIKEEVSFLYSVQSYNNGINILEENYEENKNDIEYIFLLGKGHYLLENYQKSVKYFKEALNINEDLTGIRIKYADSLAKISNKKEAKKNYEILLSDKNLSKEDKKIIQKKLDNLENTEIKSERKKELTQKDWEFSVLSGYIIKDSITSVPENTYNTEVGLPYYSKGINKNISDEAIDFILSGGLSLKMPENENLALNLDTQYKLRQYNKYDLFSYDNLSFEARLNQNIKGLEIELPLKKELTWVNGISYGNSIVFNPNLGYLFNNKININTEYKYMKNIYIGDDKDFVYHKNKNNSRLQDINISIEYKLNKTLNIDTKYSIIKENSDLDEYDNIQKRVGFKLNGEIPFKIEYKFKNMVSQKSYKKHNLDFEKTRKDLRNKFETSLSKKISNYTILAKFNWNKIDSNININDKDIKNYSLMLKFDIIMIALLIW